ncbi:hypothetical protein LCGC14_2328550, partial [marine sediment metagenome]
MRPSRTLPVLAMLAMGLPLAAQAGDVAPVYSDPGLVVAPTPTSDPDLVFTLRGGVSAIPEYFGSSDYAVGPDLSLGFGFVRLPGGRSFGSADPNDPRYGVGLRGSFRYVSERDASEFPELSGLDDIDASVELGLGVGYKSYNFDAFADVRYGVVGHESVVGEVGADLKLHPTDRLTLSVGPRVFMGSDDYADTYFGVSAAESAASGLAAYDANGGVLSAGVERDGGEIQSELVQMVRD